jgi:hypothetical protein
VDLSEATKLAKQRLYARRHSDEVKAGKQEVIDKHASRKNWRMDGEMKSKSSHTRAARSTRNGSQRLPATPSEQSSESRQLGFDFNGC